jgi:pSer/pThr/pTyr-binding forkhead associated (FHA) protein
LKQPLSLPSSIRLLRLGFGSPLKPLMKLIIEDDEGRKTVVPFVRDEITIGREEGNTIRLTERNVSRRHARLVRQNGHILVEDLGSYNGIKINGERIKGQVPVRDGDLIQIGDYDLAVQQEGAQAGAPPPIPNGSDETQIVANDTAPSLRSTPSGSFTLKPGDEPLRREPTSIIRRDKIDAAVAAADGVKEIDPAQAPRLVVMNTEYAGREFACIRSELTLGRADENHVSLNHRSLSRVHAKLRQESNGEWKVVDLESANGLSVNNEPYAQAVVRSGDVLQLGHIRFKFLAPGEAYVPGEADEEPRKSWSTAFVVGIILALVASAGGFYLMREGLLPWGRPKPVVTPEEPATVLVNDEPVRPPEPKVAVTPPAMPEPDPTRIKAAREAMTARDFEKAIDILDPLKWPDGARPALVEQLLNKSREELAARTALAGLQKSVTAGKLDDAEKYLDELGTTEAYAPERDALAVKVQALRARRSGSKTPPPGPGTPGVTTAAQPGTTPGTPTGNDPKSLSDRGAELMGKRQLKEAEALFQKCLQVAPNFPRCHKLLGAVYAKLKQPELGAEHYRTFLKLAPNDTDADEVRRILDAYEQMKTRE